MWNMPKKDFSLNAVVVTEDCGYIALVKKN